FQPQSGKGRICEGQAAISSNRTGTAQEFLDLTEEPRGFRLRLLRRQSLEFIQQFALALTESLRRLDKNLNVHVAELFRSQDRHALALKTKAPPRLAPFRNLYATVVAADGRHFDLAAERGKNHGDRHPAMQIGAVALKEWMGADGEKNVEVAGRPSAHARFALPRKPYAGPILDAGGNVDGEGALARHSPGAGTGRTWVVDHLAAALAGRAGPFQSEKSLGVANASLTAPSPTSFRPRARPWRPSPSRPRTSPRSEFAPGRFFRHRLPPE